MIDIPEEIYRDIQERSTEVQAEGYVLENAVLNGTPLPKGHGRLIDADKLWDSYHDLDYDFYEALDSADTIIEADEESEEV